MELRLATPSDAGMLVQMRWDWAAESRPPVETFEEFAARFTEHFLSVPVEVVIAVDDGPVGMAWLLRVPRPPDPDGQVRLGGDLQSVYVVPALRGQGIGTQLVHDAILGPHTD
jgi:GNAT superfamily N-acetyltransferase